MWELTKSFRFEAAHALPAPTLGAASEETHGHSFRAEVTVRGTPDPATGMVLDLGLLQRSMADVQKMLDHKMLNKVEGLGPPTLENLSRFIWERLQHAGGITRGGVHRDRRHESCPYYGPQGHAFLTAAGTGSAGQNPPDETVATELDKSRLRVA